MRGGLYMEREEHSISVRLNGKEQRVREVKNEIVSTRDEELQDEIVVPQPNNVIDFGKLQEERKRNGQPFWDDGNREKSPKLPFKRKKKSFSRVKKPRIPMMLVAALLSAIGIGLLFGFTVLTIFTGDSRGIADSGESVNGTVPTFSAVETGLPILSVEVVQGGAFSDEGKGAEVATNLQEQGLAATLTKTTEPIYMFIGVGGDRAQANKIADLYEGYRQETYLKSYRIDGQFLTEQDEKVSNWFANAIALYKEILQLSVDGLDGGTMITAERVKQLDQSLQALQVEREQAFMKLPTETQPHALAMGDSLLNATEKLRLYVESPTEEELWQTQQTILDALVHYEQVIQSLS